MEIILLILFTLGFFTVITVDTIHKRCKFLEEGK